MGFRVFLTGISGYLGGVLAAHLADKPQIERITGIYNSTMPAQSLGPKVTLVRMDIRSPELACVMADHDVVIHSAFVVMWSARMPAPTRDDINFNGTMNVAAAAVKNQIRRFIHASSVAAYDPELVRGKEAVDETVPIGTGDSSLYYWNSKAIAERILAEILDQSGIILTVFRPHYITGPCDRITMRGFRENAVSFLGCDPKLQFVQEDDVAAAFVQAAVSDMPGIYNVVPDDAIHLSEVTRLLGAKFVPTVPFWLAHLMTHIRWRYFGSFTHASWVEAAKMDFTANNAKLRATGWTPHYDCAAAIRTAH